MKFIFNFRLIESKGLQGDRARASETPQERLEYHQIQPADHGRDQIVCPGKAGFKPGCTEQSPPGVNYPSIFRVGNTRKTLGKSIPQFPEISVRPGFS